jgi:hypothetical protein
MKRLIQVKGWKTVGGQEIKKEYEDSLMKRKIVIN